VKKYNIQIFYFFKILEIVLVGFSMQGTIMDPSPRKPVEYLLYIRIGK